MNELISVLASAGTIGAMWLYGSGARYAPIVGLAGQVPWAVVSYQSGTLGLWIAWIAITAVHARNLWRTRKATR